MYLYNKYIIKLLTYPTLFLTLILSLIIWLVRSLNFVEIILNSGIGIANFLFIVLLIMPSILFFILPVTLFLGVIYCYNKLNNNSELNVLRASGLSNFDLLKPTLKMVTIICLLSYIISFFVMPLSNKTFNNKKEYYKENFLTLLVQEGIFNNVGNNLTLFVGKKNAHNKFENIFLSDNRDIKVPTIVYAKEGEFIHRNNQTIFFLKNGNRQELDQKNNYRILYFESLEIDLSANNNPSNTNNKLIREMDILDLLKFKQQPIKLISNKMYVEAHRRISWPLLSILLALIAAKSIILGEYLRQGKRMNIIKAVVEGFITILIFLLIENHTPTFLSLVYVKYILIIIFIIFNLTKFLDKDNSILIIK